MEFLDNTLENAKEVLDTVSKKAKETVNLQKKRMEVASLKRSLSKKYEAFGRAVYPIYRANGETDEAVDLLAEQLEQTEQQLEEAAKELAIMQKKVICPACGQAVTRDSKFCNHCGAQLPEDANR